MSGARSEPHAAVVGRARHDEQQIGAELPDLLGDFGTGARADRHHTADHGGNADDDAERGERCCVLLPPCSARIAVCRLSRAFMVLRFL